MAFDKNEYVAEYIRDNYDDVRFRVPKGKRQLLKLKARELNMLDDKGRPSVNRLVTEALEAQYGLDLSRTDTKI